MTILQNREMKPSGVEWLGDIPQDWDVQPLRYQVRRVRRPVVDEEIVTAFRDGQVTRRSNRRVDGFTEATDYSGYQGIKPGDLVIHAMDAFAGCIGVSDSSGMGSPVLSVCEPLTNANAMFLAHSIRLMSNRGWIESLSRSIRERTSEFRWNDASAQFLPIPSREEQDAIVHYLERETAQIDALIEKQQQLIETLSERRKAVITRAVTRGLDPTILTRPSGIVWLPSVPAHWKVIPMKHVVRLQSGETIAGEDIDPEGPYPVFGGNGFRGYTSSFTHSGEYVLIGRQGALCGNVNLARGDFWASEHAIVAHPLIDFPLTWLGFLLESMNLGQYSMTAAQPGISGDLVARLGIPLPPPEERQRISEYLDRETNQIDGLRDKATDMIALLKERRQALISAAVTGKIDVRGK